MLKFCGYNGRRSWGLLVRPAYSEDIYWSSIVPTNAFLIKRYNVKFEKGNNNSCSFFYIAFGEKRTQCVSTNHLPVNASRKEYIGRSRHSSFHYVAGHSTFPLPDRCYWFSFLRNTLLPVRLILTLKRIHLIEVVVDRS